MSRKPKEAKEVKGVKRAKPKHDENGKGHGRWCGGGEREL